MRCSQPLLAFCLATVAAGCNPVTVTPQPGGDLSTALPASASADDGNQSNRSGGSLPAKTRPLAYVNGSSVSVHDLTASLIERAGGQALAEYALDRLVERSLARRGLTVSDDLFEAERVLMWQAIHPDPDQAQRLLTQLRARRGLGKWRFARLLKRNAALRLLVSDQVEVTAASLGQAFAVQYGVKYDARLVLVDQLAQASKVAREAAAGRSFVELVLEYSLDSSRPTGGRIGPVSSADPAYPKAIRQALGQLQSGQVSPPVAVDRGFALLKLEGKTEASDVAFDDVKDVLTRQVRLRLERILMDRLARTLLDEAEIVVRDAALGKSWKTQQDLMGR